MFDMEGKSVDKALLAKEILALVERYVAMTEAWDDAEVVIDTESWTVDLKEAEEAEALPDRYDLCDVMDLVEMTPEGKWIPDPEAIDSLVEQY